MPMDVTRPPVAVIQVLPKDYPRDIIPGGAAPLPAGKFYRWSCNSDKQPVLCGYLRVSPDNAPR